MDVEYNLIPHYVNAESMNVLVYQALQPEFFTREVHREMFQFSLDYFVQTNFELTVTEELLRDEFPQFFARNDWPDNEYHVSILVDKLKESYLRRRLWDIQEESAERGQQDPGDAITWAIGEMSRVKFQTSTVNRSSKYFENFESRVDAYYDNLLRENQEDAQDGFPIGWPEVTDYTFGLRSGELGVLVAATGIGKSWAMDQFAITAALAGHKVYLASLENSMDMTEKRLDCLFTGVPWDKYERNTLSTAEVAALRRGSEVIKDLQDTGCLIIDCPRRRHERSVFDLYARARFSGTEFFLGDQLSWLKPRSEYAGNKTAQMEETIADIADISREYEIASIWAAQFNREATNQRKGRGGLSNIGLSTWIEQTADFVGSLSRTKEMEDNGYMLFEILKMRRGGKKVWLLDWRLEEETLFAVNREWNDE